MNQWLPDKLIESGSSSNSRFGVESKELIYVIIIFHSFTYTLLLVSTSPPFPYQTYYMFQYSVSQLRQCVMLCYQPEVEKCIELTWLDLTYYIQPYLITACFFRYGANKHLSRYICKGWYDEYRWVTIFFALIYQLILLPVWSEIVESMTWHYLTEKTAHIIENYVMIRYDVIWRCSMNMGKG